MKKLLVPAAALVLLFGLSIAVFGVIIGTLLPIVTGLALAVFFQYE